MHPLSKPLRSRLEATVKAARDIAETAARAALEHLGVGEPTAPIHLTEDQPELRRRLRLHGRQLGDVKHSGERQDIRRLVWEVAYEHWHRMLFARYLAENQLLMHPDGVAVSLADCDELAKDEGAADGWELAGRYAARMLPQVFRKDAPALQLRLAPEHQRDLAKLVSGLDPDTFRSSDGLGWVYQFWQAKRKDEVNASEVKIGADELPAVTQLFTEPYMVEFLLHNSLGSWWQTRHPGKPCPVNLAYLRTLEDGTPAAGEFEGWPDTLKDFKLLDPCCGSGHFIVAAFHLLVPMRMQAEALSAAEAVDMVIADNLHGLEIDPRCVEIAAFALALAAWSYPDSGGYRVLPALNIACCGLKVSAKADDWAALVPDDAPHAALLRQDLKLLHASMREAPLLGSLLDPWRSLRNDLAVSDYAGLQAMLSTALTQERESMLNDNEDLWDAAVSAQGLLDSARILGQRYDLVITNPPYLGIRKQSTNLRNYCEAHYSLGRHDIATVFIQRCVELANSHTGAAFLVLPQNWLFISSYKELRVELLKKHSIKLIANLGEGGFDSASAAGAFVALFGMLCSSNTEQIFMLDASEPKSPFQKASLLRNASLFSTTKSAQSKNPDSRIVQAVIAEGMLLEAYSDSLAGIQNGDSPRFIRSFWEAVFWRGEWWPIQNASECESGFGGLDSLIYYDMEEGNLRERAEVRRDRLHDSDQRGKPAWGKQGVLVSRMRSLPCVRYLGHLYDQNAAVIVPKVESYLPAIYSFCRSADFGEAVRVLDSKVNVTNATLGKVRFDLDHWQQVAAESYPNGLPKPYSEDPTQWLFHGHPKPATDPLQVAIARLLGYHWPAETDADMELSEGARAWIAESAKLAALADDDGIACLPPVRGEKPAAERLLDLLIAAWGTDWQQGTLDKLLAQADCAGKGLDNWLRERFFEQHCKVFQHRPFIWHVWDGLKDGFAALVNYHKLDRKNLETLIYTYLGDWIRTQERATRDKVDGADLRLAAAQELKTKLEKILEGEPPYDIFVRWKPLAQQPVGWEPDLNDGVRLNIRPFMTAEVLRHNKKPKLNITWDKDRGKDVESAPWYKVFKGDRINDHHLTLAEKRASRGKS